MSRYTPLSPISTGALTPLQSPLLALPLRPPAFAYRARRAGPPWDDAGADLVLRSCDDVDFRVHRCVLAKSCAAFAGNCFTHGHDQELSEDGMPLLCLPDPADTLSAALNVLYATPTSPPNDVHLLRTLVAALDRYGARFVPYTLRSALLEAAKAHPEEVYVLACAARLQDVAHAAARTSLRAPRQLAPVPRESINALSALQYHALVVYQDTCRAAARSIAQGFSWTQGENIPGAQPADACKSTLDCDCEAQTELTAPRAAASGPARYFVVPVWVHEYMSAVMDALAGDVRGTVARQPKLYLPSLRKAHSCTTCSEESSKIVAFSEMLEKAIDERIEKVQLELDL